MITSSSRRAPEILELVARGRSNREIAGEMGLTVSTIKTYLACLFRETGARNRTQLALWALNRERKVA